MVNSEELIGTTAYPTLCARCHKNRCHLKWIRRSQNKWRLFSCTAIFEVFFVKETVSDCAVRC